MEDSSVQLQAPVGDSKKKIALREIAQCALDPVYFLNRYGRVKHPTKGYVKLQLYPFQEETIRDYQNNRFSVVLKSRQMGLSTITAGYVVWLIAFHRGKDVVVVANKKEAAHNFISKIRTILENCPQWLVPSDTTDNRGSVELINKSRVAAYATTSDAARSESLSLLIIDEAAAIPTTKVEDLWTSASPTLFLGGSCIVISTPNGVGNWYHKTYVDAEQGLNKFRAKMLHWTVHPIYSEGLYIDAKGLPRSPWYDSETFGKSDRDIAQEFDCAFNGSGSNVISEDDMRMHRQNICNPVRVAGFDQNLWIFEEPILGEEYYIGADVARGDGMDFSAAHVFKASNNEQVAEYKGKLPPDMFAQFLYALGLEYNSALIVPEYNNMGAATCIKLQELKYPNLHYSLPGRLIGKNKKDNVKQEITKENMIPGFQTTSGTRPLAVGQLEEEIRNKTIIIRSKRLLSELETFVWLNGKPQAVPGYNDDLVMSASIVQLVKATSLKQILKSKQLSEAVLEGMRDPRDLNEDNVHKNILNIQQRRADKDPYVTYDPSGEEVDLRWLL